MFKIGEKLLNTTKIIDKTKILNKPHKILNKDFLQKL